MSDDDKNPDYTVGNRKPPKHSRFKPGQSGNPRGRRKGSKNLATVVHEIVNEKVVVNENNKRRTVTKLEATLKQLAHKAVMGDQRAAQQMLWLVQQIEAREAARASATESFSITQADELVMEEILQRLRHSVVDEMQAKAAPDDNTVAKGAADEAP